MDFFYKPPIQRRDECEVLEDNYMNCMLQKAMKDRVFNNKCVMDSILWFHLECPKARDVFDDPVEFRLKWRHFFAQQNAMQKDVYRVGDAELERIRREFDANLYPEDVKIRPEAEKFFQENKQYDPYIHKAEDGEFDRPDDEVAPQDKDYGQRYH